MATEADIVAALAAFQARRHEFNIFMSGIGQWFGTHPELSKPPLPIVHSVKMRIKNDEHVREKIGRKSTEENPINAANLFQRITDLAGVRVLHLYQEQFRSIHAAIDAKVNTLRDWHLAEAPRAYTWDPESTQFFGGLGIQVEVRESFYTSVHYLVRPRADSEICCEIQVRTLFEEIWGEVDHSLNYPVENDNLSCREQLRVLAKVVGAGSRLVDSIFRIATPPAGGAQK